MTATDRFIGTDSRSPFAGCVILILAMLVMVFLVGFSTWGLFRQFNEIARFTSERAAPVPVAPLLDREVEINALAVKLEKFRQDLAAPGEARLALSAQELNLAIAAYHPFKELRQTFQVLAVEGDTLKIAISFKLNGKPRLATKDEPGIMASDPRYLNAILTAKPQLLGHEVVLQITDITVPNATVPREFIEQMSPYRITERYQTNPVMGPVMAKLTSVETANDTVILNHKPGETPADHISNSQLDLASSRFFKTLAIGACLFLTFVGLLVFIGLRARARKG
ncbi:MAG: hypothetical protein K9N23_19685 [Akkermansiaceae bacterium]|nr:hypothetical protein [Akkermansiaceae bacterium]